ncbi:hypothetical protein GCM10018779_09900 [Streptomyces griseocarneus]|nr:hypothetical protein GCM10018779_09900 [Streptomyces griseocarneus]
MTPGPPAGSTAGWIADLISDVLSDVLSDSVCEVTTCETPVMSVRHEAGGRNPGGSIPLHTVPTWKRKVTIAGAGPWSRPLRSLCGRRTQTLRRVCARAPSIPARRPPRVPT